MQNELHIFDMSSFLYAGHINKRSYLEQVVQEGASWKTLTTPTGGTSLIFNKLYALVGKGDIVMCCDRNPTIKKDMYKEYKATRPHKSDIQVEKAAVEYILQQCNVSVIARAGYEADDIAYSLVKDLHDAYDHIYIYTGDSDYYFMVDDKVSIRPSSSRQKEVTMENYEQVAYKGGCTYNVRAIIKILEGKSNENIPALPREDQQRIMDVLYAPYMMKGLKNYGNETIIRALFERNFPEYMYRVDLAFPMYIEDLPDTFKEPDKDMIRNFGQAIKNSLFAGKGDRDFDIQSHIKYLHDNGIYMEVDP